MQVFRGRTANDAWVAAAEAFRNSDAKKRPTRLGPTREIASGVFVIDDPRQRWVHSRIPPPNVALAIAEVLWILSGRVDSGFLTAWSKTYGKYVSGVSALHDAYGHRLKAQFGVDQLDRACSILSHDPDSRQVVLQIWDTRADMPHQDGTPRNPNIPCNVLCMLKIRDGCLDWTQVLRSNDLFRGTPYNFIQFTSLQEIVAGWIGVPPGAYIHIADSLHVYEDEYESIRNSRSSSGLALNTDSLAFPKGECLRQFGELEASVEALVKETEPNQIVQQENHCIAPALVNFLKVFKAERLRQLKAYSAGAEMIKGCTNPYLVAAWRSWADHLAKR